MQQDEVAAVTAVVLDTAESKVDGGAAPIGAAVLSHTSRPPPEGVDEFRIFLVGQVLAEDGKTGRRRQDSRSCVAPSNLGISERGRQSGLCGVETCQTSNQERESGAGACKAF